VFDKTKLQLIHSNDLPWVPAEKLGLPPGLLYKILRLDEAAGEMDVLIRYPEEGYVEPRHTHEAEHWQIILEGEMHIEGQILGPGDYIFGPANEPHGPFVFPKGMLTFGSSRGGSIVHQFSSADYEGLLAATEPATAPTRGVTINRLDDLPPLPDIGLGIERRSVGGQNEMLLEARIPKGARLPGHQHPEEQMSYIVSGRLLVFWGSEEENEFIAEPGVVIHIPGGVLHGALALEDSVQFDAFAPVRQELLPPSSSGGAG
jgi:quercetin dioxygenase-like cupin family protein